MVTLGSEFWAAVAGALVGGAISGALQALANRSARRLRTEEATAQSKSQLRSLLFKVVKIESDFVHLRKHVLDCRQKAEVNGMEFGWGSFIALATTPRAIAFMNEELTALAKTKDDALFNDVLSLDDVHSSTLGLLTLYREKRMQLSESLPAQMSGSLGTIAMDQATYAVFAPRMTELDLLAKDIANLVEREASDPMALSKRIAAAFNDAFAANVQLELTGDAKSLAGA